MAGGLLNIVAYGNQNVILNGNPSKTFYKCVYAKYTNFGLQKYRIDYDGLRELKLNEESKFTFRIQKHADLLLDTYLVVNLPNIWSPIYPPSSSGDSWKPYEFKWIKNLGFNMIKEITMSVGGQIFQKYSGDYLYNVLLRDNYNIALLNEMIGNNNELIDPANAFSRNNTYPNAFYTSSDVGPEPSIRGRKLYIPIGAWFTQSSQLSFPLVCLNNNRLEIEVILRPVKELFVINDVTNSNMPVVQPNFNITEHSFYRFIHPPPNTSLTYTDKTTRWNADIHLISTFCFLSHEESDVFLKNEQKYLYKEVNTHIINNVVGGRRLKIETNGLLANWMWFLRRNDAYTRNEWNNYTNWEYDYLPSNTVSGTTNTNNYVDANGYEHSLPENIYISGEFNSNNQKYILDKLAIIFDGTYRENDFDSGIYNYLEKYRCSKNSAYTDPTLYCYNYELQTRLNDVQPRGSINLSKFKNIEIELTTIYPEMDENGAFYNICDEDGNVVGVNQNTTDIYKYTFDFYLFEEKYNIITFNNGNITKLFSL